jgi:succinoglycan biosynthesis transport protein ExoP
MLNTNTETVSYGPAEADSPLELLEYLWNILRQQLPIILTMVVFATGLGAFYTYVTPPAFKARATIIIDRGKVQAQLGGMYRELPIDSVEIDGQIQLIKSEAVALAVAKKLRLADDPEFVGPPVGVPGLIYQLRSALRFRDPPAQTVDVDHAAASAAADRVTVNRVGGYVIEIEASALRPELAAELANAFADCYIEDQLQSRYQTARQAGGWLQDRIRELGEQTAAADENVQQFKTKKQLIAAAGGRLLNEQLVGELNTQFVAAREKTSEAKARLDRIESIIQSGVSDEQLIGTVSDMLNNPIIVKLRTQYLELVNREADWAQRFGKDHQAVVNLSRQIREIRGSVADELRRVAETYKSEYEIAKQRQASLEKTVAEAVSRLQEASQAQIELRQLESSAETYRGLYRSALQRNTELMQQQSFPGTEARLITRAPVPTQKSGPRTSLVLLAATGGGLLLGLGIGVLRVSLDRVFRTSEQVETLLQANCIALAPVLRRAPRGRSSRSKEPRTIVRTSTVCWAIVDRPLSRFAEAMRSIKSAAALSGHPSKVLGFTSSLPDEGKSTIAAAFALLVAQTGARVVLVDCDLRNPSLSGMLAPKAEHGILEVTSGKKPLDEVLWRDATTNLSFLPGAKKSRLANSADILASDALRTFFEELRKTYDWIVVDLPPVAPIVDVRSTVGLVDSFVFIVEWGRTKIDVVDLALRKTAVVHENLLGVVLNKVDYKTLGRYDGRRSDYYSDKYYAQYGDDRPA